MRLTKAIFILLCVLLCSCSVTRRLGEGEYLLSDVKVDVVDADSLSRKERIQESNLSRYIKQTPNSRFLGTNFYAWVYSLANPEKQGWLSRFVRKVGEEPVIYDSTMSERSVRDMDLYMYGMGFLQASSNYSVDTARRRRAVVTYNATQSTPYRIGSIEYVFNDETVRPVILEDTSASMVRSGDIFDINVLDRERGRITQRLNDEGFYSFKVNNISYVADSSVGNRVVDLQMVVQNGITGYSEQGRAIRENNMIYRINNINVFPDFDPMTMAADRGAITSALSDTLVYEGLNIISNNRDAFRPAVLRQIIGLNANDRYSASQIQSTYNELMRLGYFRSVSIVFTDVSDTTSMNNLVSFRGANGDTTEYMPRIGLLDCNIVCTPGKRQSYTAELEGTTTSNYYGIMATLGYQNRNIFRGFELFDASLRGGYEYLTSTGSQDSFEVGGSVSFTFPRFISPIRFDTKYDIYNTISRLEFSYDVERRPYYYRTLSSGVWGYQWSAYRHESYVIRPIDISVVKLKDMDETYLESIDNPYLINSYQSQFIGGISGSYIYNNSENNTNLNSTKWRVNLETNGNLIGAVSSLFDNEYTAEDGETYNRIFGVRYAQYVRGDIDFAKSFQLGRESALVYRFYAGAGLTYGNSSSIPYEKLFYCGGSNSMRGWQARTLGPGSTPEPTDVVYDSQLGNFKLETNLEARFPLWGMFKGAVFCDLGNVWYLKSDEIDDPDGVFQIDSFYEQLGFDAGLGLRMDFNFFVFRVDWGIQIHNPNKAVGERWIQNFDLSNTALNFGIGYPF